jgi:hypothetical protein
MDSPDRKNDGTSAALLDLGAKVDRVAKALEDQNKQNTLMRKFLAGMTFGVSTAIGASVIATLIVLLTTKLLAPIGIDFLSEIRDMRSMLQTQIEGEPPQE